MGDGYEIVSSDEGVEVGWDDIELFEYLLVGFVFVEGFCGFNVIGDVYDFLGDLCFCVVGEDFVDDGYG